MQAIEKDILNDVDVNIPIPTGWELSSLGEVCDLRRKIDVNSDLYIGLEHIKQVNNALITKGNVKDFKSIKNSFKKGDILYGKLRPLLNKVYLATEDGYCSTDILPLYVNAKVITGFLLRVLSHKRFLSFAVSTSSGTKMPRTNWSDIKHFKLLIPPLQEQQKIAAILLTVDELIQKTDQIIEQTQRLKKGLMQKLLSKGIEHTEFKRIRFNNNYIHFPKVWDVNDLKDCTTKIGSGITPRGGSKVYLKEGIPLIRSQNVHFDGLRLDDVAYISEEIHNEMKNSKIQEKDVLLNITGASLGRCTLVPIGFGEGNVNQHVCIIRSSNWLDPVYLSIFLSSELGQNIIFRANHGLSREALNYQQIGAFQITIPPIEEQRRIAEIVSGINTKIQLEEQFMNMAKNIKKGLMQNLLTGKIRVKV